MIWPDLSEAYMWELDEMGLYEFRRLYECEFPPPSSAFEAGYDAYLLGVPCRFNPNPTISAEWCDWLDGWKLASRRWED
jgi:hypothetical protein